MTATATPLRARRSCRLRRRRRARRSGTSHHGLEGLLGVVLAHEILQLLGEAGGAGAVVGAFVEHPLDQRGQRHVGDKVLGEEVLAVLQVALGEAAAGWGELDVALRDLGEAQQLQCLGDREEVVDLEVQLLGQRRQVGAAVRSRRASPSGRPVVGRDRRQRHADADARKAAAGLAVVVARDRAVMRRRCRRPAGGSAGRRGCAGGAG